MRARLVVAVLLSCAPFAFAGMHDRGCGAESADAKLARQLNLSDEQIAKVHELRVAFQREQQSLQETFRATRAQLREAKQSGDAARQAEARTTLRSMRREMRTRHAALEEQIESVLTDEQRAQWDALKAERRPRRAR